MGSGDSFSCICRDGWEGRTCTHSELEGLQVGEACGFCLTSLLPTSWKTNPSPCPPHTSILLRPALPFSNSAPVQELHMSFYLP